MCERKHSKTHSKSNILERKPTKPMLFHYFRAEQCKTNGFSTSWSENITNQLFFHHFGAKTQETLTIDTYNRDLQ